MQDLYEIELIKQLKARYLRALDTKDWDLFKATLAEGCIGKYSDGQLSFNGRDEILTFMKKHMDKPTLLSMHTAHTPEIELLSGNKATGVWYLQDIVMDFDKGTYLFGAAIYQDEYQKTKDRWHITATGYSRIFECLEPISKDMKILQNRFAKKPL